MLLQLQFSLCNQAPCTFILNIFGGCYVRAVSFGSSVLVFAARCHSLKSGVNLFLWFALVFLIK